MNPNNTKYLASIILVHPAAMLFSSVSLTTCAYLVGDLGEAGSFWDRVLVVWWGWVPAGVGGQVCVPEGGLRGGEGWEAGGCA